MEENEISLNLFPEDNSIIINYSYFSKDENISVTTNETVGNILKRIANNINKNFKDIYFLFSGEKISEDKYNCAFNKFISKKYNNNDIYILVYDIETSINNSENIDPPDSEEKSFYFYFLIILLNQYLCIILFSWAGFFFKVNEILIKFDIVMIIKIEVIPVLIVLLIMSIISNEVCNNFRKSQFLIIYHVLFVFFAIYFNFFLSKYCKTKYIIIALSLVLAEFFGMGMHVLLFKNYKYGFLFLSCFIFSLIGLILLYIFWIKELFTMIYISTFWISSIGYIFLNIYIIMKLCQLDEYSYGCIIFNYGLFLSLAFPLEYIYKIIKSKIVNLEDEVFFLCKQYFILIIQYSAIIVVDYIGFHYYWKYILIYGPKYFFLFYFTMFINFLMCVVIITALFKKVYINKCVRIYLYETLYVPFIIMISFFISTYVEPEYILILLIIFLSNLIAIELFIFIFESSKIIMIFFSAVIMDAISILFLKFIYLKINNQIVIAYSVVTFIYIIIWIIFSFFCKKLNDDLNLDNYDNFDNIFPLGFNYTIFVLISGLLILAIILCLILTIGIIALVCYCLFWCCSII